MTIFKLRSPDPDHSIGEYRYVTIGATSKGHVVVVSHAEYDDECIRIISARSATTRERQLYDQNN